ncbi:Serine/Threonine kinase domain protein (macronuclear) [Tetrahymena thermophila SB210]|uniref:Serine/Threonine kinase domain protein n=1 Tax=Tetrahymena thermophila (strain SB210) TaxID=312017 RepID=I7LSW6_TETTS|nr:Serine/Threonine kinase domain protein [Tetrahymena thermophila SB210]EAR83752.4 Serine/Threonine kinase domain protein [Tetrahymena thermophila SB210]|eukprot:XP_001031415.4 Serine/Threonine kinase domain protein [Tetrahymena thermophila SB210]
MFAQHLKIKNLDQTPYKQNRVQTQGNQLPNSANHIQREASLTPTRLSKKISFFDAKENSNHSPISHQQQNYFPKSATTQQLTNQKTQHKMLYSQLQINSNTNQNNHIKNKNQCEIDQNGQRSPPNLSQGAPQQVKTQTKQNIEIDQSKKCRDFERKAHHRRQDSLMGSVCEFSDNLEQARKIPPKMQMQASKLQSPAATRNQKINQQFLVINRDTGEIYDLRNPESTQQLVENTVKAEHLKKNKLPWEEWWKQKKQNNMDLLLASQQNDFLKCSQYLHDSKGDLKAEPNFCDLQTGWAPIHFACLNCNIQLVNKLIVNEANINQETNNQVTPLMIAAEQGSEEIVILLLKAGAEIDMQDENGNTALHIACMLSKSAIIDIFLNRFKPDISIKNKSGKRCFDYIKHDQSKKYFDDYMTKITSPVHKTNSSNRINIIQTNFQINKNQNQLSAQEAENAKLNSLFKIVQEKPIQFVEKQSQQKQNQIQLEQIQQQNNISSNSAQLNENIFAQNQQLQQQLQRNNIKSENSIPSKSQSKQNISIETITCNQNKRLSTQQNIGNTDFLSPAPKPLQEKKIKNISNQKTPSQITINKFQQQVSKNGTPRSREHSKNESFFHKKGYFAQGKENAPNKNTFLKRTKQQSRPMSTNNPKSLQNIPVLSEVITTANTTVANTISNISQCGSGSSKSNSIQSMESIQNQVKTTSQNIQSKVTIHSFIIHSMLGKGSFGDVYLVQKKDNLQYYAMKVLQKSKMMKSNVIKYALTERNVLSLSNHPFIVKLNYSFQTEEKLFLILDFAAGGDMGKLLQKVKVLSENDARIYLSEILLSLEYLHKKDIIFRDLKPDNIVIDSEGHALLTDFGLSKEGVLDYTEGAKSFCGSIAYLAPEMLKRRGHGKAVDWYLFGVVMYEMLTGNPPYYANTKEDLFNNIQNAPLALPSYLSQEAKSLLTALLERNPEMRLGCGRNDANEIKNHPFFKSIDWDMVYERKIKAPEVQLLQLQLNNYNSEQFIETLIGNNIDISREKYIQGWSFVANNTEKEDSLQAQTS